MDETVRPASNPSGDAVCAEALRPRLDPGLDPLEVTKVACDSEVTR